MEVWLINDGKKEGPFPDYEIRSRLRSGALKPETKVWHSGLDEWTRVGDLEMFADDLTVQAKEKDDFPPEMPPLPPERPRHLWQRFGARWFDWFLFQNVILGLLLLAGVDLVPLFESGSILLIVPLGAVFCESILLSFWGTSPGKWLTGLAVRNSEGGMLAAGAAIIRSVRVMLLGMGMGQPLLAIPFHLLSLWLFTKRGVVLWDNIRGHRVISVNPKPEKWVAFGVGLPILVLGSALLLFPAAYEIRKDQLSPKEREMFESIFNPEKETSGSQATP